MSKGSKPRPFDKSKFDTNFDKIFGKRKGNVVGNTSSTQKKTSNLPPKKQMMFSISGYITALRCTVDVPMNYRKCPV